MKILWTGRSGQIGWELERTLAALCSVAAFGHAALDLADPGAIRWRVREVQPDVIVHAGVYTAVDLAETEIELALAINGVAPGVCKRRSKSAAPELSLSHPLLPVSIGRLPGYAPDLAA